MNKLEINTVELKIGDIVVVEWMNDSHNFYRFLFGKILDIVTENSVTKYKVEYTDNLKRWESGKKIEWWDKSHVRRRVSDCN